MAQDARRGRQNEELAGARQALVPVDSAALSTMIGAMLIGLSATDAVYRDAAARGIDRPAPDPAPDRPGEPKQNGPADAEASDRMPFHHAEDPADGHATPHPAMEVLPPPPHWDPWTRFDPLDAQVVDVVNEAPGSSPASAGASVAAAPAITASAAAATPDAGVAAAATDGADTIVASPVATAEDVIGQTMAGLEAAVDRIAASVGEIVQPLTDAMETTVAQIAGAVEDLGSAIGETVEAVGATIESVTQLAVDLPEAVLGGPEAPAIPEPVFTEAFKLPDPGAVRDVVDTGIASTSVTEPLHLGFLGQSTMDGMDAHDGAFSIFGSHI